MYSIVAEESGLLPRERLLQKGAEVLSDQELLAIVLRTGTKSESVLSMANRILKGMTSLADLSRLSLNELQEIPGIGRVKSISSRLWWSWLSGLRRLSCLVLSRLCPVSRWRVV